MKQSKETFIRAFLDKASSAYYKGSPLISDEQYDYLEGLVASEGVGYSDVQNALPHMVKMYSLQKYYKGEGKVPLCDYIGPKIQTPKLDGAAISILYIEGVLTRVLTRGNGVEGQDISNKFVGNPKSIIPNKIKLLGMVQITGEIVALNSTPNARNYAAGALNLKDLDAFNERNIYFVAYSITPGTEYYSDDLKLLDTLGFKSVALTEYSSNFPQDGAVVRVDSNKDYEAMGYTAKHPHGAYAIKERKTGKTTVLREVLWQTGKSGRVTPVAIFDPIDWGGATVTRATLNNPGFIQSMQLELGDTIEVVRSGEIIPQVVGKVWD